MILAEGGRKMEEKLIIAVCQHPELYDTTCLLYRDRNKEEQAWVKVAEETGLDGKFRKYASCISFRSGAAVEPAKRWKFSAVLSFLDPFILPRDTTGNTGRGVEDGAAVEVDYAY